MDSFLFLLGKRQAKSDRTLCQVFSSVTDLFQAELSHLLERSVFLLLFRIKVDKSLTLAANIQVATVQEV